MASPRKGLYFQGAFGPSFMTESESDPAATLGLTLGYGLSKKLAIAGTFNVFSPSGVGEGASILYVLIGGDIFFFPVEDLGLYLGFHVGAFNYQADYEGGSMTLASPAYGPKVGYEVDLSKKFSAGFDLSYYMMGEASGTFYIGGFNMDVTTEESGLVLMMVYLKYYFSI